MTQVSFPHTFESSGVRYGWREDFDDPAATTELHFAPTELIRLPLRLTFEDCRTVTPQLVAFIGAAGPMGLE